MSIFDRFREIAQGRESSLPKGPVKYLIAGLGNPGLQYEGTRHNTGFSVIDALCEKLDIKLDKYKFKAKCGEAVISGVKCLVMKPETYMNNSGEAIEAARAFYKLDTQHIIVIYDDISLPPGSLRIRRKGSDGGHNGIKSIIALTGEEDFPRIKMGVGKKPRPDYDLADWVLGHFSDEDAARVKEAAEKACLSLELMVQGKTDEAMNKYNS